MAIFLLPMLYTSPARFLSFFLLYFFSATTCCCDSDTYFYFYVFYVHHPFHNIKIIGIGQFRNHKIYSFFFVFTNFFFLSFSISLSSSSTNEFLFCLITQKKKPAVEEGKEKKWKKSLFGFFLSFRYLQSCCRLLYTLQLPAFNVCCCSFLTLIPYFVCSPYRVTYVLETYQHAIFDIRWLKICELKMSSNWKLKCLFME